MQTTTPTAKFDGQLMAEDMAVAGFSKADLARRAKCADMTVIRFLRGTHQTPKVAKKLAKVLGFSARRYLVRSEAA